VSRLAGATQAVREAIAAASKIPLDAIKTDDDLLEDLNLDTLEVVSLGLILEEVFSIEVPDGIFNTPLYRTPSGLAEWCIRKCEEAGWAETQRQRKRA
jgi:acyl carrier protein